MRTEALPHADIVLANSGIRVNARLRLRSDVGQDGRLPADPKLLSIVPRPLDGLV